MNAQPFVFSVRPEYLARILDGSKTVEWRTRHPSVMPGEMILIYETAPRSAIVAEATVAEVSSGPPSHIWLDMIAQGERPGIVTMAFDEYFEGRDVAVAIVLRNVVKLDTPRPLPAGMRAPQSWARYRGVWS